MDKKRREPEVIVFEEPVHRRSISSKEAVKERKMFLMGDVAEIFTSQKHSREYSTRETRTKADSSAPEFDLQTTLREVQSFAASNSTVKTKRKFEEEQIISLGAKPPKSQFVPYPHYQMVAKARREKEKKRAEELKLVQKKRKRSQSGAIRGKGRWKDSTKSLEPHVGRFKSGVLSLSGKDLAKINS